MLSLTVGRAKSELGLGGIRGGLTRIHGHRLDPRRSVCILSSRSSCTYAACFFAKELWCVLLVLAGSPCFWRARSWLTVKLHGFLVMARLSSVQAMRGQTHSVRAG